MNPAVKQAIEARIAALEPEINQATEILTSHVTAMNEAKAQVDVWTRNLHVLGLELDELVAALPEDQQPGYEPTTEDEEPGE